jgi:hypothetical protein
MRFLNSLNHFRQYLGRGRQRPRPAKVQSRPQVEELEGRTLLSTLNLDAVVFAKATYKAGTGVNNNLDLTDFRFSLPHGGGTLVEHIFTDTAEKITVTGPGAVNCTGSGTNQVICFGASSISSIVVDGVDGNDTVAVNQMDVPTTINHSGLGALTVNLGDPLQGLTLISAPVTVNAVAFGMTNLNVDNSDDGGTHTGVNGVFLSNTSIAGLGPAAINYVQAGFGTLNVTVNGGKGTNDYTVTNTPLKNLFTDGSMKLNTGKGSNQVFVKATSGPLAIQGSGGSDFVDVSSNPIGLGSLVNIQGNVDVRNTTPSTELRVDDSTDPSTVKQNVTLSDTALVGLAPAPITYQPGGLSTFIALLITGRENSDDTYTVTNTPGVTNLGLGKGSHQVNVQGLTGQLIVADRFAQNTQTTVVVGSKAPGGGGTLAKVNGLLNFENGLTTGTSQLIVDDRADATARTVNLTAAPLGGKITGLAPGATIQYSALSAIDLTVNGGSAGNTFNVANPAPSGLAFSALNGGNGGDTFNVAATSFNLNITTGSGTNHLNIQGNGLNDSMNIHAKAGQNTITVGSLAPAVGGSLANVRGAIFLDDANSSTALTVDDTTDPVFQDVILNKGVTSNVINFTTLGPVGVPIDFPDGLKSVDVFGGKGGDLFTILNPPSTPVTLHGGSGTNTLVGGNVPNVWNITGINAGNVGSVAFTSIQNLVGGSGPDTFRFANGDGVTGTINGGGSFNELDYSAYTTPVTVNLKLNKATGVGGFVFNIQGVIGGTGNNILVGDAFTKLLRGGSGRDILISGGGPTTLQAGSGEAILIGDHYLHDTVQADLDALMAEWARTDLGTASDPTGYRARVDHLVFGGGKNGAVVLQPGVTVLPDSGPPQTLITGAGLDFVFFDGPDIKPPPKTVGLVTEVFLTP